MRLFIALAWVFATSVPALAGGAADPRTIPLVDQSGARFRLSDLRGERTIVTFVASRCSDACPIANAIFFETYARLRRDRIAARFVSVTLDPLYDTPFVMNRLARPFGVPTDAWRFASGEPNDVRRLMRSFGVVAETGRRSIPDVHTSFVYVLDGNARLERTLLLSTGTTDELVALLRNSGTRSGGARPVAQIRR